MTDYYEEFNLKIKDKMKKASEDKTLSEEEKKNKIFVDGMLKRMNQEKYI